MAKKIFYIYRITNLVNGKTYIGQHCPKKNEPFDKYFGSGKLIVKAVKKYGKENFKKEILYNNIQYQDTANSVEIFAIAKERAIGKAEYNISDGGNGGDLGVEWRERISKALKGRTLTDETRKKLSEAHKGKTPRLGKYHSEESKRRISETNKGKVAWNKGLKCIIDENGKRKYIKGDK